MVLCLFVLLTLCIQSTSFFFSIVFFLFLFLFLLVLHVSLLSLSWARQVFSVVPDQFDLDSDGEKKRWREALVSAEPLTTHTTCSFMQPLENKMKMSGVLFNEINLEVIICSLIATG
jgi:hypothetical protein